MQGRLGVTPPIQEINAPWGKFKFRTWLEFMEQLVAQQEYFLENNMSPNRKHAERDLKGYREVLDSKSEDNAARFLWIKGDARERDEPFKDNLAVIAHMKEKGLWEETSGTS